MGVYRRCNQCDYYTRGSKARAQRSIDQHQQATGHIGQGRLLGDPITPPATDAEEPPC